MQPWASKQALVAPLQTIAKNGYLYIYVSNESQQGNDPIIFNDPTGAAIEGPGRIMQKGPDGNYLDLYNHTKVEKFLRRVAEKLETGSIALTKGFNDITSQLKEYRLKQLDKQETRKEKALSKLEFACLLYR